MIVHIQNIQQNGIVLIQFHSVVYFVCRKNIQIKSLTLEIFWKLKCILRVDGHDELADTPSITLE